MVEEAGEQEGDWTRRQARPGRARRPGDGFVPSDNGYGKWTWCKIGVKSSLWSCGKNRPPEARERAQGQQLGGKERVSSVGALEPSSKLGFYSWRDLVGMKS